MKTLIKNLIKKTCHAELDSASYDEPSSDTSCHLLPPMGRRQFSFGFTKPSRGTNKVRGELQSTETLSFRCCSERYRLMRGAAFTLAEVLITLGIIGVVAAIVMPGVINDFKVKQLKAQFETADSIITQAMLHTAREFGYEKPTDFNLNLKTYEHNPNQQYASYLNEINEVWMKQFKGAKKLRWTYGDTVKTKDHTILGQKIYGYFWNNGYLLPNGMFITPISMGPWGYLVFQFDTNGPYKGPNRYGHDLFKYTSTQFQLWCNPVYGDSSGNEGCYWYAHYKVDPKNYVKTHGGAVLREGKSPGYYWDMLFKPRSYWE